MRRHNEHPPPSGGKVSAAPIMLRASLTQDEWTTLRKLALDRKARVADLVADALRTAYLNGGKS
jgi:hypothetical protein